MGTCNQMHVTLGIYPNKQFKYNVVRDEDLENHIEFNLIFRPGRIFYVDGKRMNNGMIREDKLPEYDEIASDFFSCIKENKPFRGFLKPINITKDTRPYV